MQGKSGSNSVASTLNAGISTSAARFQRTRRAHRDETIEDYVEAIGQLTLAGKTRAQPHSPGARVKDLSLMMGVSHVTVVKIVARLTAKGLVETSRGKPILLTRRGEEIAERARRRHLAVLEFLTSIGVSAAQAEIDAEGIEHHVSDETIRAFGRVAKSFAP